MSCDPTTNPPWLRAQFHRNKYNMTPTGKAEANLREIWGDESADYGLDDLVEAAIEYDRLRNERPQDAALLEL